MHHVYLIKSEADRKQKYIGVTEDIDRRLMEHNQGQSNHTSKYRPWSVVATFGFLEKDKAYDFEKYLKSNSGRAFANKRFW